MLKRSYICIIFFLVTNRAVHAMDPKPVEVLSVPRASVFGWLFSFGKPVPNKEAEQTSGVSMTKIPSNHDMPYISSADQAKLEAAKAKDMQSNQMPARIYTTEEFEYAQKACSKLYHEYPGGPVRPASPEPKLENQRCMMKISFGSGSCCP